ncbi:Ribosomal protein S4, bacterial-type [Moorella glycerini]|uniref:Small ribosomal subunit protein uS4 n=1 Tax=Neomoorella stamsii TaxID=1266720 RepID=A0A9X7P568_9FIRM|nr:MULTISPECIES: 30S ribosomal protein S4 [Moorella]PRR70634.1 30S ribosomal protein S4 [Moorella stamsii]CEP68017.1 Ribosomal protein S4, bacterial-type [Moorella glycerini]
MARYKESTCRLCRREGIKLFLKGDRCYSDKCAVARRPYAPGQHGQVKKKLSEYGLQLREKQKARRIYGILERQFSNYFEKAERMKGVTGENLLILLERRLDNVVYRLGFADSRAQARMLVRQGHFTVNGQKVNIPSYLVRPGDVIAVREKSKESPLFKEIAVAAAHRTVPVWLKSDPAALEGQVLALPTREQIDVPVQEHLIVELYSK